MGELRIAVIGCGVAGQATALFLARAGHKVTILERFSQPAPVGAGLLLQPSGLAVLQRLGLYQQAVNQGARVLGIDGRTVGGRRVLDLAYKDLHPACHGVGIHRASLFDLLHAPLKDAGIELICGATVVALEQDGTTVEPVDDAGRRYGTFDLAIVCDGAHSSLRSGSTLRHRAPLYGWGCMWGAFRDYEGRFASMLTQRFDSTRVMIGVLPVGFNPAARSDRWVTLFWSLRQQEIASWPAMDMAQWRELLLRYWPALEHLLPASVAVPTMMSATYRDVSVRQWRQGRVIFIGDAAHGSSPQLGQGANLALLDAFFLARALGGGEVETALDRFAVGRRGTIGFYRLASRLLTPFYQSDLPLLGYLRDLAFGPACRFAPSRAMMLTTLAGIRRSAFASEALDENGLLRLPA
jgi:2-polyprenyl-6-methoxyphenol hydroxylase-like FAD-dependent oxidoreductase